MRVNVIEGPYLRDLLDQPAALRNTCERLERTPELLRAAADLKAGRYRRVVLTGMGSSYHALYPLHLALTRCGITSCLVETGELIHYQREALAADTLVVAVSQSGRSAETLGLLDLTGGRVSLIAVTNSPDSPLAHRSDIQVVMHAGPESTVSCKTYLASLVSLDWLSAVLTGEDTDAVQDVLAAAAPAAERYLDKWEEHVRCLSSLAEGVRRVFVLGRGPSLAPAATGGLILKESARFAAEGMSSAAFRHGPLESVNESVLVVVLAGDARAEELNRRLARDIRHAGGHAEMVDVHDASPAFRIPKVPQRIRIVLEILPVQMLSLALAAMTGREPGKFEFASKITATE